MLQQPKKRPSKMSLSTGVKTAADFDTSPLAVTYFVHASIARGIMKQIRVHILCTLIFYMHIFLNEKTSHIWNAFLPKHLGGRHYSRLTPSCTVQMNYLVFFLTASMVAVFPPVGNLMC